MWRDRLQEGRFSAMRRSVVWFFCSLAAILGASGFLTSPGNTVEAAGHCLPDRRLPVTVLVRSTGTQSFTALSADGAEPFIDAYTSRTVVPMRSLFEALSPGPGSATWNEQTRTATFAYNGRHFALAFPPGTDRTFSATVDGKHAGIYAMLCGGRVWVQARPVLEALGVSVQYYEGGIVTVDPLPEPLQPSPIKSRSTTRVLTGYGQVSAPCSPFPESFLNYLVSPAEASRQAGEAVACRMLQS